MAVQFVRNGKSCTGHRFHATATQKNLERVVPDRTIAVRERIKRSSFDIEEENTREEMREIGTAFMNRIWG